ncbi:MAG: hypothetical protein P1V51_01895 [Deltaproteobacteria bacterium]|nr:hypothetical protein [Deltaproteobacteria bacterium]
MAVALVLVPGVVRAAATPADGRGILSIPLADTVEKGRMEVGLWFAGVIDGRGGAAVGGPMGAALGFHERGEVSLSTRMDPPSSDEQSWRGPDAVRAALKWRYLDEEALRPGVAVDFGLRYVAGTIDLAPRVVVQKSYAPFQGVVSLGYDAATGRLGDQRRGLTFGVGAQGTFHEWRPLAEVGFRLSESQRYGLGALHFSAGTAYEAGQGVQLSLALTGGIGPEAASFRVSVGLIYGTAKEREVDHDSDGVADLIDRCPFEPETINRIDDEDGCPDGQPVIDPETGESRIPRFTTPTPRFRMRIRPTWSGQEEAPPPAAKEKAGKPAREGVE